jgi:energy-coupling factor transporter ATP-binding protein EcfA2
MRCALAAALLIQSDVLILDEPTNFLVRLFHTHSRDRPL